jgi:hypothetical protein
MNNINKMIAYVQIYIHIRKGVEVNINIQNGRDILLLTQAYNLAIEWMNQNNFRLIIK